MAYHRMKSRDSGSGGCNGLCSFLGAAIFILACALMVFGAYTSTWQSVTLANESVNIEVTVGCGLLNCTTFHTDTKTNKITTDSSAKIPDEKINVDNSLIELACKPFGDYCAKYNAMIDGRKYTLTLCNIGAGAFLFGSILGVLGALGKCSRASRSVMATMAIVGCACAVAAVVLYATQVAGVSTKGQTNYEDWDNYDFGLSFYAVVTAAGSGLFLGLSYCFCPSAIVA